jgi:hypothetical protein
LRIRSSSIEWLHVKPTPAGVLWGSDLDLGWPAACGWLEEVGIEEEAGIERAR